MQKKIFNKIKKIKYANVARKVRQTEPVGYVQSEDVIIISQVYHDAVDMTLVALKSFISSFGQGTVEILDDGSLTEEDRSLFEFHIPGVRFHHIDAIDIGQCPKGGCWERLIRILELTQHSYVIQVDTDTLTKGPVQEVWQHYKQNRAFTIGSPLYDCAVDLDYLSHYIKQLNTSHVQGAAECALLKVKKIALTKYIRGCAAFTGFPKGCFSRQLLDDFSLEMESLLGKEKWNEWGSEQFASNVIVSMCPNANVLPWPKYQNFGFPKMVSTPCPDDFQRVSVLHFIGSNRFDYDIYSHYTNQFISKLKE